MISQIAICDPWNAIYLHKTKSFIDISANRKIIDSNLSQNLVFVNDKQTTEADTIRFLKIKNYYPFVF